MDGATKAVIWIAAGVVIVTGVTFLNNDYEEKKATKEAACKKQITVTAICMNEGPASSQCFEAINKCVEQIY